MRDADYSAPERFWAKVDASGPCWEFTGAKHTRGYGAFAFGGVTQVAHRVAWQLLVGPIPDGLVLDHMCRNKRCVNPDHLQPVTNAENLRRGAPPHFSLVTACPKGHPYDDANTCVRKVDGARVCRTCRNVAQRRYREQRASAECAELLATK